MNNIHFNVGELDRAERCYTIVRKYIKTIHTIFNKFTSIQTSDICFFNRRTINSTNNKTYPNSFDFKRIYRCLN